MNEVKTPKKPMVYYYTLVLLALMLFNFFVMPAMVVNQVKEVDYSTFMDMTYQKQIGKVDVESNQIIFTNKDESQIYKTGLMNDPDLIPRLYENGAEFSGEIVQEMSPFASILMNVALLMLFIWLGQYMMKRMMNKAGGPNSMMFGMGKSNAKIYVKSTEGIKFSDVAGEDEAKENLAEIVEYLHTPDKYREIGASMP